jgi:hypothetical protein
MSIAQHLSPGLAFLTSCPLFAFLPFTSTHQPLACGPRAASGI